jgi:hypothetical protein
MTLVTHGIRAVVWLLAAVAGGETGFVVSIDQYGREALRNLRWRSAQPPIKTSAVLVHCGKAMMPTIAATTVAMPTSHHMSLRPVVSRSRASVVMSPSARIWLRSLSLTRFLSP